MTKIRIINFDDGKNPFIELRKRQLKEVQEQQEQHNTHDFVDQHSHKLKEKPHHEKHKTMYTAAKVAKWFGHTFSIILACSIGFLLGGILFQKFDIHLATIVGVKVTLASILTGIFAVVGSLLLELAKSHGLHSYFLDVAKYGKRYVTKKQISKLIIPVGISLILSFCGGYMAVNLGMGTIDRPEYLKVDINEKTSHLNEIIQFEKGLIEQIESTRKENGRLAHGSDKKRLDSLTMSIIAHGTMLIESKMHWEKHNEKSKDVTQSETDQAETQHAQNKFIYGLMLALLASIFDIVSILSIRTIETYIVKSLKEIRDLQREENETGGNGNGWNAHVPGVEPRKKNNNNEPLFEIVTHNNEPHGKINETVYSLKDAKKRVSTYKSKLKNNNGLTSTNQKNIELFQSMVDYIESVQSNIPTSKTA